MMRSVFGIPQGVNGKSQFALGLNGRVTVPYARWKQWKESLALVVPQAAETWTLTEMLSAFISTNFYMHLFSTNVTVNSATTLSTLAAAECTFTGYAAVNLTGWSSPTIGGDGSAGTTSGIATFTPTGSGGSGNVWGYYLTDSGASHLWGAENFGSALTFPQNISFVAQIQYTILSRN